MSPGSGDMGMSLYEEPDLEMQIQEFNPLKTPYEVDERDLPRHGSLEEQYVFLLRYATLAPSSHNTQPWKFAVNEHGIEVYADYTRRLPVADPGNRELYMSVGAAIFNIRVAAAHFGIACRVDYNHTGDSESPIAFIGLSPDATCGAQELSLAPLFASITRRHTNRNPFLFARISRSTMENLGSTGGRTQVATYYSLDGAINAEVANLVAIADRMQQADPEFRRELSEWIRPNFTRKPDGITGAAFGINGLASAVGPWATKMFDLGSIRAAKDKNLCLEAPGLVVLYGEESIPVWLETGEALEHLLLTITQAGLQYSFFNMPIEIPELRTELRKVLGLSSWPQLLLRIGFCLTEPAATPRRPVEDVLIDKKKP